MTPIPGEPTFIKPVQLPPLRVITEGVIVAPLEQVSATGPVKLVCVFPDESLAVIVSRKIFVAV